MNYITLQEITKELVKAALISITSENGTDTYTLTESGINTLSFFEGRIPPIIKNYLDNNSTSLKSKVLTDSFITANIIDENNEFIVNCKISENEFSLVYIKLTVGTRADAQLIWNNWKKNSQKIYSEIIESLTKRR